MPVAKGKKAVSVAAVKGKTTPATTRSVQEGGSFMSKSFTKAAPSPVSNAYCKRVSWNTLGGSCVSNLGKDEQAANGRKAIVKSEVLENSMALPLRKLALIFGMHCFGQ